MPNFEGVFPVYDLNIQISTNGNQGEASTFSPVADMEDVSISIETGVETWNSITEDGWQRALATAKSYTMSIKGKRCVGDPGNDYIASKAFANGRDCDSRLKIVFPDGATFEGAVVIKITDFQGGKATDVGPLGADLVSNGKPAYTPGTKA